MRDIYGCQQVVSRPALIWTHLISNTCAVWDCGSQVQNTGFVGRDINVLHHKSNKTGQFKKGIGKGVFRRKRREISCIFIQTLLIYDEYLRSEHYWPSPLNKKSPLLRVCAIGLSCPLDLNPLSLLLLLSFLLWAWASSFSLDLALLCLLAAVSGCLLSPCTADHAQHFSPKWSHSLPLSWMPVSYLLLFKTVPSLLGSFPVRWVLSCCPLNLHTT